MAKLLHLAGLLDRGAAPALTRADWRSLIAERYASDALYQNRFFHYLYRGDGVLHLAAAAHRADVIGIAIGMGAALDARGGRRLATALHYAADGVVDHAAYDPVAQAAAVRELVRRGADIDALDKSGATPLLRAIRCRAWAAVDALIAGGADWRIPNGKGTSAVRLATVASGRGGSGTPVAKDNQARIIALLQRLK